eukprot:TRINITY_DN50540_c0_g1_i1.p2 TRINITY_DN50540_c0_g1~~TRINITY_DN50540_c0_g1_i1.p2  ORF type:complete len:247 (-),score=25.13 TRINITY_DN50540_c0_g1_i1:696-1436(-)
MWSQNDCQIVSRLLGQTQKTSTVYWPRFFSCNSHVCPDHGDAAQLFPAIVVVRTGSPGTPLPTLGVKVALHGEVAQTPLLGEEREHATFTRGELLPPEAKGEVTRRTTTLGEILRADIVPRENPVTERRAVATPDFWTGTDVTGTVGVAAEIGPATELVRVRRRQLVVGPVDLESKFDGGGTLGAVNEGVDTDKDSLPERLVNFPGTLPTAAYVVCRGELTKLTVGKGLEARPTASMVELDTGAKE